jgi:hypothetical protein
MSPERTLRKTALFYFIVFEAKLITAALTITGAKEMIQML